MRKIESQLIHESLSQDLNLIGTAAYLFLFRLWRDVAASVEGKVSMVPFFFLSFFLADWIVSQPPATASPTFH